MDKNIPIKVNDLNEEDFKNLLYQKDVSIMLLRKQIDFLTTQIKKMQVEINPSLPNS